MKKYVSAATLTLTIAMFWGLAGQSVQADEPTSAAAGNVPDAMLAQFGLGQMQVLSDEQGEEIRGSGFYFISGHGHSYNYRQFRPVGKLLYGHKLHGYHGHKHKHSYAPAINKFAFHFQSKFFGHRGYRFFLPIIAAIHGGGAKHR